MPEPKTLLELAGADLKPATVGNATLLLIDYQNEYIAGTDLHAILGEAARKDIIIAGFMTHMCVSSTARAALDLGYRVTIDAGACATRDLPDGAGSRIDADVVHRVAFVELSDRFAIIARDSEELA
jgi:nicotinamidase-related amidase